MRKTDFETELLGKNVPTNVAFVSVGKPYLQSGKNEEQYNE